MVMIHFGDHVARKVGEVTTLEPSGVFVVKEVWTCRFTGVDSAGNIPARKAPVGVRRCTECGRDCRCPSFKDAIPTKLWADGVYRPAI